MQFGKITLGAVQEIWEELCKDLIGARATSSRGKDQSTQETDVYREEKDGVSKQTDGVFGKCKRASAHMSTPYLPPCLQGPASAVSRYYLQKSEDHTQCHHRDTLGTPWTQSPVHTAAQTALFSYNIFTDHQSAS